MASVYEMAIRPPPPPVYSRLIDPFPDIFNDRVEKRLKTHPNRKVKRDGITNTDSYPQMAECMLAPDDSEFAEFIQVRVI
jgi:hypothetical protein